MLPKVTAWQGRRRKVLSVGMPTSPGRPGPRYDPSGNGLMRSHGCYCRDQQGPDDGLSNCSCRAPRLLVGARLGRGRGGARLGSLWTMHGQGIWGMDATARDPPSARTACHFLLPLPFLSCLAVRKKFCLLQRQTRPWSVSRRRLDRSWGSPATGKTNLVFDIASIRTPYDFSARCSSRV